jgi:hypothetical protein
MAERRRINYGKFPKKKIRIGVSQIMIVTFALTSVFIFSSRNLSASARATLPSPPPLRHDEVGESSAGTYDSVGSSAGKNSFHFIISSDCTSYQRWETLTQLHSAQSVNQCGRFTWIVSGWYVSLFWLEHHFHHHSLHEFTSFLFGIECTPTVAVSRRVQVKLARVWGAPILIS